MIRLSGLRMHYGSDAARVDVLRGVDLEVFRGERVAVTGPSGCGKTTLLLLLAGLEPPAGGSVSIGGADLGALDRDALADLRRDRIGIVFQSFHLIPTLTAIDNVALPLELARRTDARAQAQEILTQIGLAARTRHYPGQLSGGEQQRVAIARALVHRPAVVLADEPTGNLDRHTGATVTELLFSLVAQCRATLVLVTHDPELANRCDRILRLADGVLDDAGAAQQQAIDPTLQAG